MKFETRRLSQFKKVSVAPKIQPNKNLFHFARSKPSLLLVIWIGLLSTHVFAIDASIEGALTGSVIESTESNVDAEILAVLDLDAFITKGESQWHVYVEGTTTSRDNHVTAVYGEANADAGAAADANGDGRLQVSVLEYIMPVGPGEMNIGLIYPSGFSESGDWSNDETSQFVGASFVNIQTIANPDYALGIGYTREPADGYPGVSLVLSQAEGLGDLDGSYHEMISGSTDLFLATELHWDIGNIDWRIGAWFNNAKFDRLDGNGTDSNLGFNMTAAWQVTDQGLVVFRYGIANDDVSRAAGFWGLTYQQEMDKITVGLGVARITVADSLDEEGAKDTVQSELYLKYRFSDSIEGTFSYQRIENSNFGTMTNLDMSPGIYTVRLSVGF